MKQRAIKFSGYEWGVKEKLLPAGPGPNYFSPSRKNVWVDSLGRLHLKIIKTKNKWQCAEVYARKSLGYGKYLFDISTDISRIDKNIILGLFTYLDLNNEIDIEFSRWGKTRNQNAQFVVQPFTKKGNIKRFDVQKSVDKLRCSFLWEKDKISFECWHRKNLLSSWVYKGKDIPKKGREKARINLWLLDGKSPLNKKGKEVVIEKFEFHNCN